MSPQPIRESEANRIKGVQSYAAQMWGRVLTAEQARQTAEMMPGRIAPERCVLREIGGRRES